MATWMRFELTTSAVTGRHSNQLNYQAIYTLFRRMVIIVKIILVEVTGLEPVTPCL